LKAMKNERSVAVTGIGVFTSIGCNREDFWESLKNGKSGVNRIQAFDPSDHKTQIAAEILNYNPADYFDRKESRKMARSSQLASSAAIEAVKDAGLNLDLEDRSRIGAVIGSGGDYTFLDEASVRFSKMGPSSVNPLTVPRVIPNMPVSNAAMVLGIHGPVFGTAAACTTGAHSIGIALDILRSGRADVVLAGGSESTIIPLVIDAYSSMGVLSESNDEPSLASSPFDLHRDGFVMGEGACVLVLETLEHAEKRGAKSLALLKGFGMTNDAFGIAAPEPSGKWATIAMEMAIKDAQLRPEDIDYVNAHGTATRMNDKTETLIIKNTFKNRNIPVSSTKSMIGHTLSAAGAIEAAACILALQHGILPPTINHETPDPECSLDVIPNQAREADIQTAISNSFGFGGQNGVLVFSKA